MKPLTPTLVHVTVPSVVVPPTTWFQVAGSVVPVSPAVVALKMKPPALPAVGLIRVLTVSSVLAVQFGGAFAGATVTVVSSAPLFGRPGPIRPIWPRLTTCIPLAGRLKIAGAF